MTQPVAGKIPFNDLFALHQAHRAAFHRSLDALLDQSDFIGGRAIADFEQAFAQACGVKHAVGLANGTDALTISLKVCGVGPSDLVVTVPNSFMATAEAISLCGAEPLFVDVNEEDFNLDVAKLDDTLRHHPQRHRIKTVVPVHLFGRSARLEEIAGLCKHFGLPLIADGAQAHLATCNGRPIAQWADLTTFSFYPGKNLGALGDAGAVVGQNPELIEKIRCFSNHGRTEKYLHESVGTNARLDTLQAYFLLEKLPALPEHTRQRQTLAQLYDQHLRGIKGLCVPKHWAARPSVGHLYVVCHERRDELQSHLKKCGIETGVHYPIPLHLQPAYAGVGYKAGDFPICEKLAKTQLSLPIFPSLTVEQLKLVCGAIEEFCQ